MKKVDYTLYNASNERVKYQYRIHLRQALKKDEKTIIAILKHLRDYEIFTRFVPFSSFNDTVADKYISDMFTRGLSISYISIFAPIRLGIPLPVLQPNRAQSF